jgi:hypothetical protein
MLPSETVHAFWTTAIRQIPEYTKETGLLTRYFSKEVLSNVPHRSGDKPYYLADLDFNNFFLLLVT